ncbi:AEC family transporter [Rhizobium sp. C4]|uniref:AEC family transporter n=1 Tax=Rhizobium sp. C4 TaxID=1349800 RepID=UPI001E3AE027|nr:AEC family transporter [Rhizobium sp. C4]MCD2171794.1 AEC family transporter [Rhizobium sp. C4]
MLPIFESILPVFLVVIFGALLKRAPWLPAAMWDGLERLGYYVLFPALLFTTLSTANFGSLPAGKITVAALGMVVAVTIVLLVGWPIARRAGISASTYTSIFQTTSRWNGFVALAVAEKLYGKPGIEVVAYVMAIIVLPLNIINVGVLLAMTGSGRTMGDFVKQFIRNPIILGCATGVAFNLLHIRLYPPLEATVEMVANTSLPLGLMMLGAGLRISDALRPNATALWPVGLKLLFTPLMIVLFGIAIGIQGVTLMALCICGAVPTAMNGYLLAKQMGGDAPLYAAVTTLQTAASFFTIPLALYLTAHVAG